MDLMAKDIRFALTGCGVVSGAGVGCAAAARALSESRVCVRELDKGGKGAVAPELDPTPFLYQRKALKLVDRRGKLALQAAREAAEQAGIQGSFASPERSGVSLAVGMPDAGEEQLEDAFRSEENQSLVSKIRKDLNPLWLLGRLPNIPASHLSIQFQARGPVLTSLTGRQALQDAMDCIANGEAEIVLAGATEAWFSPVGLARLEQAGGRAWGEAAVVVVVESKEHAIRRGVPPLRMLTRRDPEPEPAKIEAVENCLGYCGCAMELLAMILSPEKKE